MQKTSRDNKTAEPIASMRMISADDLRPVVGGDDGDSTVAQTAKGIIDSMGR